MSENALKDDEPGVPVMAQQLKNLTSIHEDVGSIPALAQGSGIAMNCGVGHRCGSDPALLWLWHTLAAEALIRVLPWELPYASSAALKKKYFHNCPCPLVLM